MRIKSGLGLVVGAASDIHWGQVLVTPNAYGLIEVQEPEGKAQTIGASMLSQLSKSLSIDPTSLKEVEEIANHIAVPQIRTLILLVPVGKVVYLVMRGSGAVYLKRGSELASLMHEEGAVSGEVRQGDTILLSSEGFLHVLSREELTGLFDHLPPAEVAEKLTLLLHEKTGGDGSVALVFGVSQLIDESLPPEEEDTHVENSEELQKPKNFATLSAYRFLEKLRSHRGIVLFKNKAQLFFRHQYNRKIVIPALLFMLFFISVGVGVWKQSVEKRNRQVQSVISDAQHMLDEGIALLDLNPAKGRERLSEAKARIAPYIETASPRSSEGRRLASLNNQIQDNMKNALQIVQSPMELFYDMELLKKGAVASYVARDQTMLAVSDASLNTVYLVNSTSKNAQILGGGGLLTGGSLVSMHGDAVYIFTPDGIVKVELRDKKPLLVIPRDENWGTITAMVSYGGNIYLLDTQKSRIWKYVAVKNDASSGKQGFSETREYLNPDTLPDLSAATGLSIDGSVWLGTTNGTIFRFTQGKENTYQPKGVEPAFGKRLMVYTSDDTTHVYVLDTELSRVVVLDKEGMYIAQYQYTAQGTPSQLLVSESQKKLFLLSDGKLYAIELK